MVTAINVPMIAVAALHLLDDFFPFSESGGLGGAYKGAGASEGDGSAGTELSLGVGSVAQRVKVKRIRIDSNFFMDIAPLIGSLLWS